MKREKQVDLMDAIEEAKERRLIELAAQERGPGQYYTIANHHFFETGSHLNWTSWLVGFDEKGWEVWSKVREEARRFTYPSAQRACRHPLKMVRYNEDFPRKPL
jgi:hypothetical protein